MKMFTIVKANLIKQIRSHKFIWMLAVVAVLGVLCVPPVDANYSVVCIGGLRGIYNSAWLGAVAAIISCVAIWIPGFYWLRSEISEDRSLRIGDMLASSPISKSRYIIGKALANMIVLLTIQLLFIASFIVLQFLRGESYSLNLFDYIIPFFIISIPNLLVLASLTIVFDAVPFLRGVIGNIAFIIIWPSVMLEYDIFGRDFIMKDMQKTAALTYPGILAKGMNFGINPTDSTLPTFEWRGLSWHNLSLLPVIACLGISVIFIALSILSFDRFKRQKQNARVIIKSFLPTREDTGNETPVNIEMELSSVKIIKQNKIALVINEIRIMLLRLSLWQYLLIIGTAAALPFINGSLAPIIMLTPITILSKMGCREKIYRTIEIVYSVSSPAKHMLSTYAAGIAISLIVSSIQLVYLGISGDISSILSWLIGIVFACALALFCGEFSGNTRLFEAVYMLIYYLWLNKLQLFDFLGATGNRYNLLYVVVTAILLFACFIRYSNFPLRKLN